MRLYKKTLFRASEVSGEMGAIIDAYKCVDRYGMAPVYIVYLAPLSPCSVVSLAACSVRVDVL